jgi:hypothetical protein
MAKVNITRTIGPIHFEDLEPHRFEDLTRQLLYDFKDWQNIEATGRGGSDDGFDVRAHEKNWKESDINNLDEHESSFHPMDGNLWKIQCKRELKLGPTDVAKIISDGVYKDNPPYGYILIASTNFSKKSYDVFREGLLSRGVMEFYLWGKAELEDLLFMPKNDRILFTYFGISLTSMKRSQLSARRSVVQVKNKVMKVFGDTPSGKVLLRTLDDNHYPSENKYPDFSEHPRWKQFAVKIYSATGFFVEVSCFVGYLDSATKEWDYTTHLDMVSLDYHKEEDSMEVEARIEKTAAVHAFMDAYPERMKKNVSMWGFVKYKDIQLIDEVGDPKYQFPHIYLDKPSGASFFDSFMYVIESERIEVSRPDYKRIKLFPDKFPSIRQGKFHEDKQIILSSAFFKEISDYHIRALFSHKDAHPYLEFQDQVTLSDPEGIKKMIVTFRVKYQQSFTQYLQTNDKYYRYGKLIAEQVGKPEELDPMMYIYEFDLKYQQ